MPLISNCKKIPNKKIPSYLVVCLILAKRGPR